MLREPSVATSERYEVIRPLGSGSYGVVYEALDTQSGQRVAIKELNELSASAIGHFKQEFRALADCHHPNLVGLRALIEDDGRWRIVMELVPGTDFLGYVRRADNDNAPERMACDEGRLRRALRGMAEGLAALHRYGVVHRDLKPANVRVTEEGRAVLLDFGLVTRIDAREQTANVLIGTAAYMAPELGREPELGPAADWYALGVCLFEALTGERPFEGRTVFELLELKQQAPAPRASSRVRDVPPDLDALCAGLLEREPAQRFGAAEVMGALTLPTVDDGAEARAAISSSGGSVFAGREAELSQLVRAQARSAGGERAIVLVEGESGVGKSELVAEFVRRFEVEQPSLLTLHGRCYENEQVVYKAFDGCIDDLARFLRHLPHADCERLLPLRAAVLGQLFPVLRSVSAIATAPRTHLSAEPMARRFEAFAALSALLAAVAATRPVVLVIDDLQWADAESFRLLHALVAYTESLPLLIVATLRPREELEPEVLEQVDRVRALRETRLVPLLGLPLPHAQELAGKLLGGGVSAEWLAMIARESEGHPLLLSELVRYTLTHGVRGAISLGGALRARIEQLEPAERSLLEMVAIAGRPFGSPVFAAALGVDSVEVPARKLLASKLLRLRRGIELGVYHDRIRHEAVSLVARSRLPSLHRRLAEALTRDPRSDASEQAHHWDRAGEIERAIEDYRTAATRALEALAFVRAAHLAQRALELLSDPRDPRVGPLTVQRATALACAGINAESAQLYLRAAHQAEGAERLMLRSRAAQQLLLSGDLKRGFAAAMALFAELDVRLPKTMLGYLASWIYDRLWGLWPRRFVVKPMRTAAEERGYLAYNIVDELRRRATGWTPPSAVTSASWPRARSSRRPSSGAASCPSRAAPGFCRG